MAEISKNRIVTLRDVAQAARVSLSTASLVLNDRTVVAETTARRVRMTMDRLGYRPNPQARLLRRRTKGRIRTGRIVFVSPEVYLKDQVAFWGGILRGCAAECRRRRLNLVFYVSDKEGRDDEVPKPVWEGEVDGALLIGAAVEQSARKLQELQVPFVAVNDRPKGVTADCVIFDDFEAGRLAAQYLIELGHRRLVYLTEPPGARQCYAARLAGFRAAVAAANLSDAARVFHPVDGPRTYSDIVNGMFEAGELPTGIVTANDGLALTALQTLHKRGVPVPAAASIVGIDDRDGSAQLVPPLTTVRLEREEMGAKAVARLIEVITGDRSPCTVVLPVELMARETTEVISKLADSFEIT